MHFSLQSRAVSLSVGEFASFSLGPSEDGGGTPGLWRAQLGQHWHNELQKRTLAEAPDALFEVPIAGRITHRGWTFELQGRIDQLVPALSPSNGPALTACRPEELISDRLPVIGTDRSTNNPQPITNNVPLASPFGEDGILREIKSVLRPLPADEAELRADYPAYFLQLATYVLLRRTAAGRPPQDAKREGAGAKGRSELSAGSPGLSVEGRVPATGERARPDNSQPATGNRREAPPPNNPQPITDNGGRSAPAPLRAELVFVEAGAGLVQTVVLTPFDEALVYHQLDAVVEFLNLQLRAAERRHHLQFHSPFSTLRPGQETIQADLLAALRPQPSDLRAAAEIGKSKIENPKSRILLLEAPTGYGKTGCVLEFALGQLKAGRYERLIWLTGKSTGQIQVMHTLRQMTEGVISDRLPVIGAERSTDNQYPIANNPGKGATPLPVWQVRNKAEHCVNHTFHCVRDSCDFLRGGAERWPGSGLARFYADESQPRDLESLRAAGHQALICPYEITRAALPFNDVWIGDFNYVFAPDNRGVFFERPGFDPARTLLVVDEAHNLPSRVAGAFSLTVLESDARLLLAELDHLRAPPSLVLAVDEWTRLLGSLGPAETLDPLVEADVRDLLERLARLAANTPLDYAVLGPHHSETLWSFVSLHTWLEHARLHGAAVVGSQLSVNSAGTEPNNPEPITDNPANGAPRAIRGLLWVPRAGQLEFTCLDAADEIGATLREFGGVILMSATLQPYAEFAESCGLPASCRSLLAGDQPCGNGLARDNHPARWDESPALLPSPSSLAPAPSTTLHAPTPWRAGAYDVAVDLRVDTSFRHRAHHYRDTAATIVALAEAAAAAEVIGYRSKVMGSEASGPASSVPNNPQPTTAHRREARCAAVFFPSYAYAEAVQKTLDDYGSVLRVALQPKLPDLAAQTAWVEENLALSDVLFLVLGSSFAEGIDLLGGRVTHAMVVGPALPEVNAVQKAKLAALDHLGRDVAFRRVYQIPGLQKVNQALGRLVRAPGQHAKVLLHCRRFAEPTYASLLAADYQMYREIATEAELQEWLGVRS